MCLVRVGSGVGEPVPIRWPAAEVAALIAGLGGHRGAHPDPGAGDLPLGLHAQCEHHLLIALGVEIHPPTGLGHPQLHAVVLEQRGHQSVLAAVKGPLALADHDRVEPAVRAGQRRQQRRRLRAARPRQHPAPSHIKELRHDPPEPRHQRSGLIPLARPGRDRILMILGRHPAVEHEPQPAMAWPHDAAAPRPLRPLQ